MRRISRSIDDCLRKLIHPMWLPAQLMVLGYPPRAAALVKDGDRFTKSVRSSKKEAGDSLGETGRVQENEFPIQENKLAARDFLGAPAPGQDCRFDLFSWAGNSSQTAFEVSYFSISMHHTSSCGKMPHRPLLAPPPFPQPPVVMTRGQARRNRIAGPFRCGQLMLIGSLIFAFYLPA